MSSECVFLVGLVAVIIGLILSVDKPPKSNWIKKEKDGVISYTLKKKE